MCRELDTKNPECSCKQQGFERPILNPAKNGFLPIDRCRSLDGLQPIPQGGPLQWGRLTIVGPLYRGHSMTIRFIGPEHFIVEADRSLSLSVCRRGPTRVGLDSIHIDAKGDDVGHRACQCGSGPVA